MNMFNGGMNGYNLSDIAAVTKDGEGVFGGNNGWWIILLFLFAFGGGGFGFGGDRGLPCATQPDVRAAVDQQTLISKLDQQTYGLADSTYALNNTIVNGFHGVDNAISFCICHKVPTIADKSAGRNTKFQTCITACNRPHI